MEKQMRLDRMLGEMGKGTRSQIREAAKCGRIAVNGRTERSPQRRVDPEADRVTWDGEPVVYASMEYYMLNKPAGVVSATKDRLYGTAVELVDGRKRKDLFPVGRLDVDTEGLLLITNDGALAHRLLSPKKHVDKVYLAEITGKLPADGTKRFEAGLVLADGTQTLPALLEVLDGREDGAAVSVTIREGMYHQVKRMFEALGCRVVSLKRIAMGPLVLDEALNPGQWRPLTDAELLRLKECTGCLNR